MDFFDYWNGIGSPEAFLADDLSNPAREWAGKTVRGLERLDFLKIDVDGYEAKLLRGASETLRHFHPTMILEVCEYTLRGAANLPHLACAADPHYGTHVKAMLVGLRDLGYGFFWEEDLSPVVSIGDVTERFDLSARSINLVCVP